MRLVLLVTVAELPYYLPELICVLEYRKAASDSYCGVLRVLHRFVCVRCLLKVNHCFLL